MLKNYKNLNKKDNKIKHLIKESHIVRWWFHASDSVKFENNEQCEVEWLLASFRGDYLHEAGGENLTRCAD